MNKREKPERRFKVKESGDYNDNLIFNQACVQWEAYHQQEIARLEKEKKEWKDKYIDLDKSLKAELRDPNGTIWEYAERLEEELVRIKGISVEYLAGLISNNQDLGYDCYDWGSETKLAKQIHSLIQGGGK